MSSNMEPSPPLVTDKLTKMVRVVSFMIRKGFFSISKSTMIRRGKSLGKAVNDLVLQQHASLVACRSHDIHMSFVSPREYEFSCSNSPSYPPYNPFQASRRRGGGGGGGGGGRAHYDSRKYRTVYKYTRYHAPPCRIRDEMEDFDGGDSPSLASPLVSLGLGRSPRVRQVRITDSPFSMREADGDYHVDKEAEKFIASFYRELRLQKWMMAGGEAVVRHG